MEHLSNHIGVWMDRNQAIFVYPFTKHNYHVEKMLSGIESRPREDGKGSTDSSFGRNRNSNDEYHKHNTEREQVHAYFKSLEKLLGKYDEILLFGPGKTKDEFFNYLMDDKAYAGKRIEIETADQLNDHEVVNYVKSFYETRTLK